MNNRIVTIEDVFAAVRRDRWWVVAIVGLFLLIGGSVALLGTPVYRAEVSMISAEDENSASALGGLGGDFGFLASVAGLNVNSGSLRQEALAILESRAFTQSFIDRNNLMPVLFASDWSAEKGGWRDPDAAPTLWDAVNFFDAEVRQVYQDNSTGVIRLTIDWSDAVLAAEWANRLVSDLNERMRERVILEAERSIEYLNKELEKTKIVDLESAIYGLIEEHIKRKVLANVREDYAFKMIDAATPPDKKDYVFPNRPLILVLSFVIGATFAGIAVLVRSFGLETRPMPVDSIEA